VDRKKLRRTKIRQRKKEARVVKEVKKEDTRKIRMSKLYKR